MNNLTTTTRQNNDFSWRINIIYNSMIIVSILMIIASIITAIGVMVWLDNFSVSAPPEAAYGIGAWVGLIGGIIVILLGLVSIALFIYRVILQKQSKKPTLHLAKRKISLILFIVSWILPLIVFLIELSRFL